LYEGRVVEAAAYDATMSGDDDVVDVLLSLRLLPLRRIAVLFRHPVGDLTPETPRERLGEGLVGSAGRDGVVEEAGLARSGAHLVDVEPEFVDRLLEEKLEEEERQSMCGRKRASEGTHILLLLIVEGVLRPTSFVQVLLETVDRLLKQVTIALELLNLESVLLKLLLGSAILLQREEKSAPLSGGNEGKNGNVPSSSPPPTP
jgi:hypothetical protein